MKANCVKCGKWFHINKELENLIEEGIIHPLDINLCNDCAELEADNAEYSEENVYILNDIEL